MGVPFLRVLFPGWFKRETKRKATNLEGPLSTTRTCIYIYIYVYIYIKIYIYIYLGMRPN